MTLNQELIDLVIKFAANLREEDLHDPEVYAMASQFLNALDPKAAGLPQDLIDKLSEIKDKAEMFRQAASATNSMTDEHFTKLIDNLKSSGLFKYYPYTEGDGENLEKMGMNSDWKKEGYRIESKITPSYGSLDFDNGETFNHDEFHDITAFDKGGKVVGSASIAHSKDTGLGMATELHVAPEHRRKGIASGIYDHFKATTGSTIAPSYDQSHDAKNFWAKRNRPFGKAEELKSKAKSVLKKRGK